MRVAPEVLRALQGYDWPGNIRELRNVIERAVVLCEGKQIELADLPPELTASARPVAPPPSLSPGTSGTLSETKEAAEALRISEALVRNNNNKMKTALELGISRMTLYKKLYRYGLLPAEG